VVGVAKDLWPGHRARTNLSLVHHTGLRLFFRPEVRLAPSL
jgi:hypothetical protein